MIGTTLQRLIDEKNTNVNELARTIGVSAQTLYSIIKRDNMKIDFDVLLKICDALNVDVAVFYTDYMKNVHQQEIADKPLSLSDEEYPIMTKYRRLNDSGKEYVDSQVDYALSQERYQLKEKRPPHIPDMKNIKEDAEAFVAQLKKQSVPTEK